MPRPRELDVNITASGDNAIVPAVAGYSISIMRMWLEFKGATSVKLRDGIAGTFFNAEPLDFDIGGIWELDYEHHPHWSTSKGNSFVLNSSAAVIITGRVYYILELVA